MRKDLGKKIQFMPLPVLMIGTYDENGKPNLMNAAWGGIYDYNQVYVSLSKHKTTDNLEKTGAFTISFATVDNVKESDYFGIVSANSQDKIAKAGFHAIKSEFVNAPIFEEYPLTLECKVVSFDNGALIGEVVNISVDEKYFTKDGKIDVDKIGFISFDMIDNKYRVLGKVVGKAFKDGLEIKNK